MVAQIRQRWPSVRCVLCSSYVTVPLAVEAMRCGADYVASKDETIVDVIAALDGRPRRTRLPSLDEMERELVRRTLAECDGNKSRAARQLGITRQSLHEKLARWAKRTKPDA